jgi:hypothetical protein
MQGSARLLACSRRWKTAVQRVLSDIREKRGQQPCLVIVLLTEGEGILPLLCLTLPIKLSFQGHYVELCKRTAQLSPARWFVGSAFSVG